MKIIKEVKTKKLKEQNEGSNTISGKFILYKIKWWLQEIIEKKWVRIIYIILLIPFIIFYILVVGDAIPDFLGNIEVVKWLIAFIVIGIPILFAFVFTWGIIKGFIEDYKENPERGRGILIGLFIALLLFIAYRIYLFYCP